MVAHDTQDVGGKRRVHCVGGGVCVGVADLWVGGGIFGEFAMIFDGERAEHFYARLCDTGGSLGLGRCWRRCLGRTITLSYLCTCGVCWRWD